MAVTAYRATRPADINLYSVDTVQKFPIGTICTGIDPTNGAGEFIYLSGIGSTVEGSAVTYDEAGVTALLAANAKGPVAIAMAATVASTWGWYQILGKACAKAAASSADNTYVGREGADGSLGDGRAAGDEIVGAIARSATDGPATGYLWLQMYNYPFVNDATGS